MIDPTFIITSLVDLVKINSINPSLEEDGGGEQEIGDYIATKLTICGWEVVKTPLSENRLNVIAIWKGSGGGRSLLINAHMDTVGIGEMPDPFCARIDAGKLYGRGAYDMKGSIAAMMGLAKAVADFNISPKGDIILAFVADEEYASIGTESLLVHYSADACIVTEPTDLKVCLGHRGFGVYEISTFGTTAHGGLHKEGVDANIKMGKVLNALSFHAEKLNLNSHPLFGGASLHVPLMSGGQSLFIYANKCTAKIERRTLPGESSASVKDEFQKILNELADGDPDFKYELIELMWRNPYEVKKEARIVSTLCNNLSKPAEFIGHAWWEDSGLIGAAGIETVIFGPMGGGIHQPDEWVDIPSVQELSRILLATSITYCNQP